MHGIGQQVKPHSILLRLEMIETNLSSIREILAADRLETILESFQSLVQMLAYFSRIESTAIGKEMVELPPEVIGQFCRAQTGLENRFCFRHRFTWNRGRPVDRKLDVERATSAALRRSV